MGLHKGHTNNPNGRPHLLRRPRQLCVRLDAAALKNLKGCCRLWQCNISEALRRILSDEAALLILKNTRSAHGLPVTAARFLADARRFAAPARSKLGERPSQPAAPEVPEFITEKDMARLFKVDRLTLRRLRRKKGGLPYIVLGRTVRYPRQQVREWLSDLAARCKPQPLSYSGARYNWENTVKLMPSRKRVAKARRRRKK